MAGEFSNAFKVGESIVPGIVDEYYKGKEFRELLQQRKEAKEAERPYTPEEISAFQTKGTIPANRPASQQLALLKSREPELVAGLKAKADLEKNFQTISKDEWGKMSAESKKRFTDAGTGPEIPIHKSTYDKLISQGSGAKPATTNAMLKDAQFWDKQWVDTGKDMDLQKASSRTPLGVAVTNNMKAGRGMKLLESDKMYTPQDESLVTTDLTAIMKGGSPDEELLRSQQYGSYYKQGIELLQKITGNPKMLNDKQVRQHLKDVIKGIREIDNQAIKNHIDTVESTRSDVIKKRPEQWNKLKEQQLRFIEEGGGGGVRERSYSDPRKAEFIRTRFKAGEITREEARKQLQALGQ